MLLLDGESDADAVAVAASADRAAAATLAIISGRAALSTASPP
jgi:hypothetical protein